MPNNYDLVDLLEEFKDMNDVQLLDEIFDKNKWTLIKTKDEDNLYYYQLYFGKDIQVDNMYEYGFSYLLDRKATEKELSRFLKYRKEIENMKEKDNLLNKITDKFKKNTSKEYDKLTQLTVNGTVRGAIVNSISNYTKELNYKNQDGMISVDELLKEELGNDRFMDITFCDNEMAICLHNSSNDTYIEPIHECFDIGYQNIYLVCNNKVDYDSVKFFINQSSKYHSFIKQVDEFPDKESFKTLFNTSAINKSNNIDKTTNMDNKISAEKNSFELDGKISKIGKTFYKKDGTKSKFLEIQQVGEFKGKPITNIISIMLEEQVLNQMDNIKINDNVSISGTLSSYIDNNNQRKIVVNCKELEINKNKNIQDLER